MLDKAALAICNQIRSSHDLDPIKTLEVVESPDLFRLYVRAALQAIREPDEGMFLAGNDALSDAWCTGVGRSIRRQIVPPIFTAMIDAILNEKA